MYFQDQKKCVIYTHWENESQLELKWLYDSNKNEEWSNTPCILFTCLTSKIYNKYCNQVIGAI